MIAFRTALLTLWFCFAVSASTSEPVPGCTEFQPTATHPVGWRGVSGSGNGAWPGADPVTAWSETSNVVWKTDLPSYSGATPVVAGGRVFILSEPNEVYALDLVTGRIVWRDMADHIAYMSPSRASEAREVVAAQEALWATANRLVARKNALVAQLGKDPSKTKLAQLAELIESGTNDVARREWEEIQRLAKQGDVDLNKGEPGRSHAADAEEAWQRYAIRILGSAKDPDDIGLTFRTPVCDGERLYVVLHNNLIVAYRLDGTRAWAVWDHLDYPDHHNGVPHVPSPILIGERLIVLADNKLKAFDRQTGRKLWMVDYRWNKWVAGTPVRVVVSGKDVIVGANGCVYRVEDGRVLADELPMPIGGGSPVAAGDVVFVSVFRTGSIIYHYGGKEHDEKYEGKTHAIRLSWDGPDRIAFQLLWSVKAGNGWRGPAYHDGLVYLSGAQGTRDPLRVVDAVTGAIVNTDVVSLGDVLLGGRYLFSQGQVATAGRNPRWLARNPWFEMQDREVAFAGDRMLVRTRTGVICIGNPAKAVESIEAKKNP